MLDSENQVTAFFQFDGKRNIDSSGIQNTELSDNPHVAAFRKQRYFVSLVQAESHKSCSHSVSLKAGLFKCRFGPMVSRFLTQENVRRELASVFLNEIDNCRSCCHIK